MVWFNRKYVSRALEKFCPRASSTFIAGASTWFRENPFLNFQLEPCAIASMLAEHCWETNMAQSQFLIWLIFWGNSKRVWHMCPIFKLITNNRCLQHWLVVKFFPRNRDREYEKKWRWYASTFGEPRSFELEDTFLRLKPLCLTI